MRIFISYAAEDRDLAEQIHLTLTGVGHETFFDSAHLPTAQEYHQRIYTSVQQSDALVFLASPQSIEPGSYALTELKYARDKWPHPKGRVIPVRIRDAPWEAIPNYLKAVTVLEPVGSVAAETLRAVAQLQASQPAPRNPKSRLAAVIVVIVLLLVGIGWTLDSVLFRDNSANGGSPNSAQAASTVFPRPTDRGLETPSQRVDYAQLFQANLKDELRLAELGEHAYNAEDFEWTIKFLAKAKNVRHRGDWQTRQPFLIGAYLATGEREQAREELDEMLLDLEDSSNFVGNSERHLANLIDNLVTAKKYFSGQDRRLFEYASSQANQIRSQRFRFFPEFK